MKKTPKRKRAGRAARSGTYEVGYGRPPKKTRWKPGHSGNRRGRPKGAKGIKAIVNELFNRRITVRDGQGVRTISALEGMMLRFLERAMNGDPKAAAFLIELYDEQPVMQAAAAPVPTASARRNVEEFLATKYRQMLRTVG
jgi:hypothetical protein